MELPDGLSDQALTEGLARSLAAIDPGNADALAIKGSAAKVLADSISRHRVKGTTPPAGSAELASASSRPSAAVKACATPAPTRKRSCALAASGQVLHKP